MDYKFVINDFEGPLDLLLHLVKTSEMDIYDISVEKITEQYLEFIRRMEEMNLTVASEYLVMAAELIELKSRLLLPNSKNDEDDEYEEDPRENLIKRLIEYKKIKESTPKLKELEEERKKLYTKVASNMKQYQDENQKPDFNDIDLDCLLNAFSKFLERKEEEKPLNTKITKKEYSVSKRSREIKSLLRTKQKINFEELFEIQTKEYIVVTFLSILALAKKQELIIKQDNNFSNIVLSLRGCE